VALIYNTATLTPSKIELLTSWVGIQPWAAGTDAATLDRVGTFRFDDPAGAVGIETHLLRSRDGRLWQIPLTYRSGPLAGAEDALVGTMEHSVLGTRWVYDACADPVYALVLATTILTGGRDADLELAGSAERMRGRTHVSGSGGGTAPDTVESISWATHGTVTAIRVGPLELSVRRSLDADFRADDAHTLTGTWPGNDTPLVLAALRNA
jgi:hypothetical protein